MTNNKDVYEGKTPVDSAPIFEPQSDMDDFKKAVLKRLEVLEKV